MKQFQCQLTADALQRLTNLAIFDSLVVQVEAGEYDDTSTSERPLRAVVFLHGKIIAQSGWQ